MNFDIHVILFLARCRSEKLKAMKKSILNKVKMYDTVRTVLSDHESVWIGMPTFVENVELFNTKLDDLKNTALQHEMIVKGVSKAKAEYKTKLIDELCHLQNALLLHSGSNGLTEVRESIRFTRTDLKLSSEMLLFIRATRIKDLSNDFAADLVQYGITATTIQNFEQTLTNYDQAMTSVRNNIVARKTITSKMDLQVETINRILKEKIDILIRLLAIEHPNFAQDYKNARLIVHSRGKTNPQPPEKGYGAAS